jgi:hypothetical protein
MTLLEVVVNATPVVEVDDNSRDSRAPLHEQCRNDLRISR